MVDDGGEGEGGGVGEIVESGDIVGGDVITVSSLVFGLSTWLVLVVVVGGVGDDNVVGGVGDDNDSSLWW